MAKPIDVLYEDENCLILNKPAGLAVQGGAGVSVSLDTILSDTYNPRPLLVHRLDRDTSGVILVAKNKNAAAFYSQLMGDGKSVCKQYLAACSGKPVRDSGLIRMEIDIQGKNKYTESRFTVLKSASFPIVPAGNIPDENGAQGHTLLVSLLELEPETGRMHQLRRHMAVSGTPILGDDKYGDFSLNKTLAKTMKLKHMLLHAYRLTILRGHGEPPLVVEAPLPPYFAEFLEKVQCPIC
ncbi:MAG: RluA family pseudouridine synthase [Treponema sp.]|nr:RluA family pseudouridine synthase [Treponema sp.]